MYFTLVLVEVKVLKISLFSEKPRYGLYNTFAVIKAMIMIIKKLYVELVYFSNDFTGLRATYINNALVPRGTFEQKLIFGLVMHGRVNL